MFAGTDEWTAITHGKRASTVIGVKARRPSYGSFLCRIGFTAKVTCVEVEEVVPIGSLDKDNIHTPGIYVDKIFAGAVFEKRIERVTTRPREALVGA